MRSLPLSCLIAVVAGALSVLAYAPVGWSPLMVLALAVLWWLLDGQRAAGRAAVLGFAWGLGAFLAGLCWLYVALHVYGGMAPPFAVLALLLFCSALALYPALACWVFARLRSGRVWQDVLLFAACWTLCEWLRGHLFTGFPWLAIGYTQTPPSPLAGWAPVLGLYGMGTLLAGVAALVGALLCRQLRWQVVLPALAAPFLMGAALRLVSWTQPSGAPLAVALIQTNIPQETKWQYDKVMEWLQLNYALVRDHPATLMVLPETTLPLLEPQLPEGYQDALGALARKANGDLVLGVLRQDEQGRIYNSVRSLGTSPVQAYSKNHLVPFGEYSPPLFGWFYRFANIPMSDQTRGGSAQPPLVLGGQQIAVNICYEDVFGEEIIRSLPQATLMLNVSNLAWYGDSHAQPQHLQIARMRALETGRPMLRATNTGMTAVVQPDGTVAAVLPAFTRGVLRAEVQGYSGMTPYAGWGNVPIFVTCLLFVAWQAVHKYRSSPT